MFEPAPTDCFPAHLTRTAGEFLGRRPLPWTIVGRSVVFLLGPSGSGKSTVALRLANAGPRGVGPGAACDATSAAIDVVTADGAMVRAHLVSRARNGRFPMLVEQAPVLILDGVDCLFGREGAVRLLGALLGARSVAGRRTVLVQGCADDSLVLLYPSVPPEARASVLLRFPVGRGRRRFVQQECKRVGLPFARARELVERDPWTYATVREAVGDLAALSAGPTP